MPEQLKICTNNHAPIQLNRMKQWYRGLSEPVHIGEQEAWQCPICGAVYAFPIRSDNARNLYSDDRA